MSNAQDLWSVCESFYFPRKLSLRSDKTRYQYRCAIRDFSRHLGHAATLNDLDDDSLVIWMKQLLDAGLSPYTVRERAGRVLTLWTWLAKRRVVDRFPTVERPDCPDPQPQAWTEDEMRKLFEAAMWEPGHVAGILARHWWTAYLAWLWVTGERCGATMKLTWGMLFLDEGTAVVPAGIRKGGKKPAVYRLPDFAVEAIRQIQQPERERVFPWPHSEGCYYYRFGRILKRAGLPAGRHNKTHAIRVSHATWRARLGDDPTKALLHSDPATTRRHYLDFRLLEQEQAKLFRPW